MTVVGVDVSSRRVDLAWLNPLGQPCRWHQQLATGHLIDRLRSIHIQWPEEVTEIAIEYPFGRSRAGVAALMATVGVITKQAPTWARVAWPSSGELRAAIGACNTKASAHEEIHLLFPGMHIVPGQHGLAKSISNAGLLYDWDEHELDALTAAIGWQRILAQQDAA